MQGWVSDAFSHLAFSPSDPKFLRPYFGPIGPLFLFLSFSHKALPVTPPRYPFWPCPGFIFYFPPGVALFAPRNPFATLLAVIGSVHFPSECFLAFVRGWPLTQSSHLLFTRTQQGCPCRLPTPLRQSFLLPLLAQGFPFWQLVFFRLKPLSQLPKGDLHPPRSVGVRYSSVPPLTT